MLGARWEEVDLDGKLWTVPAPRMKGGRAHRVPLSNRAVGILRTMADVQSSDFVFPGTKTAKPLSSMALAMVLRRAQADVAVHGFRSAFRDWAGERTSFAREVAEAVSAHLVGDEVERAYRRGDALDKCSAGALPAGLPSRSSLPPRATMSQKSSLPQSAKSVS